MWPCSVPVCHGLAVSTRISGCSAFSLPPDLYCTLEVDSFGYFVSKAKTRVFRDTTEPQWNEVRVGCGMWGKDHAHLPAQALELI